MCASYLAPFAKISNGIPVGASIPWGETDVKAFFL